jgi:hypothetical protein
MGGAWPELELRLADPRWLTAYGLIAGLVAWLAYAVLERRARPRWVEQPTTERARSGPYRSGDVPVTALERAPLAIRVAALGSLLFGVASVPSLLLALSDVRFHGLAVLLVPAIGVSVATMRCGGLLLARSRGCAGSVKTVSEVAITLAFALLPLSVLHFLEEAYTSKHAGLGVAVIAFLFAQGSLAESVVMLIALRRHRAAFEAADQ